MNLLQLGWAPFFEQAFLSSGNDSLKPARIIRQNKNQYIVHDGSAVLTGTLLGRMLYESEDTSLLPAVGDWVSVEAFDDDQVVIHAVLPRSSAFFRKEAGTVTRRQVIAANIDVVFLVSGLDKDFNLRRIERYLVQASSSGAHPVILLNKADLRSDITDIVEEVRAIAGEVDVLPVSVKAESGIEAVRKYLKEGTTVAFLGSSGVGKSSIANLLIGADRQSTGQVREDDSRGRHTTTHRELIILEQGGIIIDTPGLRELQLWGEEEDLQAVFEDIDILAQSCKFRDCQHNSEPGCAVRQALEDGELDAGRYQSYQKLKRELAYLNLRQDEMAQMKAKKREKEFGKLIKRINRYNPKK